MPRLAALPSPAAIAVGVASTNAHGQNTTCFVTPLLADSIQLVPSCACDRKNTIIAAAIADGITHAAHLSAAREIGAFFPAASSTSRASFDISESPAALTSTASTYPVRFAVPA